jgi:hypothetical protein
MGRIAVDRVGRRAARAVRARVAGDRRELHIDHLASSCNRFQKENPWSSVHRIPLLSSNRAGSVSKVLKAQPNSGS